jgi:hypothetical protein
MDVGETHQMRDIVKSKWRELVDMEKEVLGTKSNIL